MKLNFKYKIGQKLYELRKYDSIVQVEYIIIEEIKINADSITYLSNSDGYRETLVSTNWEGKKISFAKNVFATREEVKKNSKLLRQAMIEEYEKSIIGCQKQIECYKNLLKITK